MSATTDDRSNGTGSSAPGSALAGATRLVDYWSTVYRRTWKGSVISSFVTPLLYILAMGVLLGGFIKSDPDQLEGATSYLAFVAPGMLAAQAMTTVFGEVTYPVMGMIKWAAHLLRDDRLAARDPRRRALAPRLRAVPGRHWSVRRVHAGDGAVRRLRVVVGRASPRSPCSC